MEKVYQSINAEGLQIPLVLMRQYGLGQGSSVVLELQPDGIRIIPAQPDQSAIENRALRYLLSTQYLRSWQKPDPKGFRKWVFDKIKCDLSRILTEIYAWKPLGS